MDIKVIQGSLSDVSCDVLIVNLFEGVKLPAGGTGTVDAALDNIISEYVIGKDDFKGKLGDTYVIPSYGKIPAQKILLIGLGKAEKFDSNTIRLVASKAIKKSISFLKAKKVCSILHGAGIAGLDPIDCAQMTVEGTLIGAYKFSKYKTKKNNNGYEGPTEFNIVEIDPDKLQRINEGLEKGKIIAEAVNYARDLVNEPASFVTPSKLAENAKSINGIECTIIDREEAEKLGMGSYLAVAKGSSEPPKFIHMTYRSANPVKKIALVGKGITFDSGGLDIKPASSMTNMKDDMSGAAAVLGIMNALTKLKPDVEVHGIIAACENMPSSTAYKPGDILKALNGKTIEVDNTDAEGRLTLADALAYADNLKVDQIIDLATLTGACLVALGYMASGIMGNNQELIDILMKSADRGGERLWQLPMYKEYFEGLKSDVADFKNSGPRWAGASTAGLFLKEFVSETPWAHIDIAGPAYLDKEIKELAKGPSGVGVRTLLNHIMSL
ncbi:MAG: leucyl aminopeptidase [Candidatus Gastranaerophilales bacterium]|nr:leucyl aminopeptidase [Candidatus Gastranaerophilales bacterium]